VSFNRLDALGLMEPIDAQLVFMGEQQSEVVFMYPSHQGRNPMSLLAFLRLLLNAGNYAS
jgi:hypothetical protein